MSTYRVTHFYDIDGNLVKRTTDRQPDDHLDNWATEAQLETRGICPDPAVHKLHTDGRCLYETCPLCGHDEALKPCTVCGRLTCQLIPWSGEKLCWDCTDTQLDLMSKALQDMPVQVGGFGLR